MKKFLMLLFGFVFLVSCSSNNEPEKPKIETSTLTYNGYTYKTVKIGNQWWLAENLRTTKYNDGTDILYVPDFDEWLAIDNSSTAAYCVHGNILSNANYGLGHGC